MKAETGVRFASILSLTGVIFSAWLLYHHVTVDSGFQLEKSFCSISPGFDCDAVARSEYAELLGVPIASYSLFFYLALYLFCKSVRPKDAFSDGPLADVLFAAGVLALVPSLVLLAISLFVLKTVCLMCSVLYVVGISVFMVAYAMRNRANPPGRSLIRGLGTAGTFFVRSSRLNPQLALVGRLSLLLVITTWFMLVFAPSWIQKEILFPKADSRSREKAILEIVAAWKGAESQEIVVNRSADLQLRDFVRGDEKAPFVLTIFSDFECPFCKRVARELHELPPEIRNNLRLVFKNYPLDSTCNRFMGRPMHPLACKAAIYGRCAGAQGEDYFWRMHDALFTLGEISEEAIEALPVALGLDREQFSACLASPIPLTKIREDIELGSQVHVEGTPAMYLNGRPLLKAAPEIFQKIFTEGS